MKRTLGVLLAIALAAATCRAQNIRWDTTATTTAGTGASVPLLAIPGVAVTFYNYPAMTLASTYNSATAGTPCPTYAQVVPQKTAACVGSADFQGNFGAWFTAGQYAYSFTAGSQHYGPFNFTIGGGSGSGSVTSVGLTAPAYFTVMGSPVTGAGTLTFTGASGLTAHQVLGTGSAGALAQESLGVADLPFTYTGSTTKLATSTGILATNHCAKFDVSGNVVDAGAACGAGGGSVTTFSTSGYPAPLGTVSVTNPATTPALVFVAPTYSQNFVLAGPTSGSGSPTARLLAAGDLPLATSSAFGAVKPDNSTITILGGVISSIGGSLPALVASPTPASTTFLQALNSAKSVPVRIDVFGDSFTIDDHTNAGNGAGPLVSTNRWGEQIRTQLQAIYGSHGTGVYPVIFGTSASVLLNPEGWSCTGTTDTSTTSLGPSQQGLSGSNGNTLLHMATGATCTFADNRSIPYTNFSVYYATPAGTSSLAILADGVTSLGTATAGSATATGVANGGFTSRRFDGTTTMAATTHSVLLTCTGDCYLYAGEGVNGTTGISVDMFGEGGSTSIMFGSSPTNQLAWIPLIPGGVQAAIYMDQTNDAAFGITAATTFTTNIQNIINFYQALASAPTFMLAIPPVDIINGTAPMAAYTAAQLALCTSNSLTCINTQDRGTTVGSTLVGWGTTYNGSSGLWDLTGTLWPGGSGGVHPGGTHDQGTLDEAQMIYAELVNPTFSCTVNCVFTKSLTLNDSGDAGLLIQSASATGSRLIFDGTGTGVHKWMVLDAGTSVGTAGALLIGDLTNSAFSWKQVVGSLGTSGYIETPANIVDCWSSTSDITVTSCDTGLSRHGVAGVRVGNGTFDDASGTVEAANLTGTVFNTTTNCASSASPAVCGAAAAGRVTIAAGATTITVNTSAISANSEIVIQPDETLGTALSVTCNTTLASLTQPVVTGRVAATSFTLTTSATIAVNPACYSYSIVN